MRTYRRTYVRFAYVCGTYCFAYVRTYTYVYIIAGDLRGAFGHIVHDDGHDVLFPYRIRTQARLATMVAEKNVRT